MGDVAAPADTTDTADQAAPAPSAKSDSAASADTADDYEAPAVTAMGDYAGPSTTTTTADEAETTTTAPTATADEAAPADDYEAPAMTPMGDYAGPSTPAVDDSDFTIGPSSPSSREQQDAPETMDPSHAPTQSTNRTTTTSSEEDEATDEAPAYTPMGDLGLPGPEASYAPHVDDPELDAPYGPAMQQYGPAYDPSDPVSDEAPTYTPMGDLALPGTETHTPAPTTEEESTGLIQTVEPTGWEVKGTAAFGPLGGTVAFARDDENTALTFGPAEGFGLFGSCGEARAPAETSMQMSGRLGLGVASGEVTAGSAGITGKVSGNVGALNQGINQQVSQSLSLNRDGLQTMQTEGVSAGWVSSAGAVVTQTVTISVSNDTLDMVGGWIGLGPEARPSDSTGGGGAW
jgi:hypothetical protein